MVKNIHTFTLLKASLKVSQWSSQVRKPFILLLLILLSHNVQADKTKTKNSPQVKSENIEPAKKTQEKTYNSKDDVAVTIEKVFIEKFSDNMNSIYSEKAQEKITSLIESEHQWEIVTDPKLADIVVSSRLTKNPKSMAIKLSFTFTKNSDLMFSDAADLENVFETEKVLLTYENLYAALTKKIPYQGIILSRNQNQVTLNIGRNHGLVENQDVLAILIAKIKKHPKTGLYISAEKEVLGKITITKVDEFLSFGKILYERDDYAIQKNTKLEFSKLDIHLANENSEMKNRPDSPVVIGDSAHEWVPSQSPQYGKVSITGGLIQYTQNLNFTTAGSKTVGQWLTPTIKASGELWINPEFHIELFLRQSSFKVSNPLDGSEPGSINTSLSQYQIKAKYNYELDSSYRAPQFQASIGMGQFQASVDTSTPVALSTHSFGGIMLGFNGQFPISEEVPVDLGLYFNYFLTKTLGDSASATPSGMQINDFGLMVHYLKSQRLSYVFELSFEYYASDFDTTTGTRADPINSASHRLMTTLAGIEYSF